MSYGRQISLMHFRQKPYILHQSQIFLQRFWSNSSEKQAMHRGVISTHHPRLRQIVTWRNKLSWSFFVLAQHRRFLLNRADLFAWLQGSEGDVSHVLWTWSHENDDGSHTRTVWPNRASQDSLWCLTTDMSKHTRTRKYLIPVHIFSEFIHQL